MGLRVAVLEDDGFTRLTLVSALRAIGLDVVIESGSPSEIVKQQGICRPQIALLDLHLGPGPTGLDVALQMRSINRHLGLVFISSFDDPRLLNPNLPALPDGSVYLKKSRINDMGVLKDAIKAAVDSGSPAPDQGTSPLAKLTNTQIETLKLMALGLSNVEIARRRFVTERSVEIAIARLAKKIGVEKDASINQRVHIANVYFRAIGQHLNVDD